MSPPRRVLFVCHANRRRSVTAELVFRELLENHGYEFSNESSRKCLYVDSAGIDVDPQDYCVKQMTQELGDWAERIFTFSSNLEFAIVTDYKQSPNKIRNLNVADRLPCGHPELIEEIREKLLPYLSDYLREN